ncbi:hypothetical protein CEXT_425931 [Caerostris extrusa]|uniref:Uncharacterized protein n=1 Tax=Caerostris extrusa TaxID=172846 RepID=A0AAV4NVE4_CAEEX|nr:hypothetical protein CEXT_425931 [Caerostris extrusa]
MVENLKAKFSFATYTLKESECCTEKKKVASICATRSKSEEINRNRRKKVVFPSFLRPDEMKRVVTKRSLWVLRLEIEVIAEQSETLLTQRNRRIKDGSIVS